MTRFIPQLIGRHEEQKILTKLYESVRAEFLALYGRRRIGKTFLVRNFFKDKGLFFEVTGSYNVSNEVQLKNFYTVFKAIFLKEGEKASPKNWQEAFTLLVSELRNISETQKIILFFDELPWLAGNSSDFLSSFEYMWNRYLSQMPNVKLIVCGSAASWMIKNIVNNTGGLHNRLTYQLRLLPFNLAEAEEYLKANNIFLKRKHICEIYMVTGGVPLYLSHIRGDYSSAQNINNLCFQSQAPLLTEFHYLYTSLFDDASSHLRIIKALAQTRKGLSRQALLKRAGLANAGLYGEVLQELEEAGFIMTLPQIYKKTREKRYNLVDAYTYFYFKWIEPYKHEILNTQEKDCWIKKHNSQSWKSWSGYAFETICLTHIMKIKEALQIGSVSTHCGYWSSFEEGKKEVEVDLVIDRADDCINLCEIKFHNEKFVITPSYAKELERKKILFQKKFETKKTLFITLITPFGCEENQEYHSIVNNQLVLDDLFA